MKQKTGFLGRLLPLRKHGRNMRTHFGKDPELYYAIGLVVLWLIVFLLYNLKYLNQFK